jgi:hypothetical protein
VSHSPCKCVPCSIELVKDEGSCDSEDKSYQPGGRVIQSSIYDNTSMSLLATCPNIVTAPTLMISEVSAVVGVQTIRIALAADAAGCAVAATILTVRRLTKASANTCCQKYLAAATHLFHKPQLLFVIQNSCQISLRWDHQIGQSDLSGSKYDPSDTVR